MKICLTELMKKIKNYQEKKAQLVNRIHRTCTSKYKEKENKVQYDFDFVDMVAQLDSCDEIIRRYKSVVAEANQRILVEGFDVTIGESLIMLAQLSTKENILRQMGDTEQLSVNNNYRDVEYVECNYDVDQARQMFEQVKEKRMQLQIAIDRANLTSYVQI